MSTNRRSIFTLLENSLPWVTLLFIGYFTYAFFYIQPYVGFTLVKNAVQNTFIPESVPIKLYPGDILLRVRTVTHQDVEKDLRSSFFTNAHPGDRIEIVFTHQGHPYTIQYTLPGFNTEEFFARLNSQWFIPYIFWMAGLVTILFLRPRSQQRLLLALFNFSTAAWISIGMISGDHLLNSALILRSLIWLCVPIYLHLHWIFPTSLRRLPTWLWSGLYAIAACMAVISWLQLVPEGFYFIGFILGILGSLVLLVVHIVTQPGQRHLFGDLFISLSIILLPIIAFGILGIFGFLPTFGEISLLGLAAMPGFYFFTLYRRQLSAEQSKQASRLIRIYQITILISLIFCLFVAIIAQSPVIYDQLRDLDLAAMLILGMIALINFTPFIVLPALSKEEFTLGLGGSKLIIRANRTASNFFFLLLEMLIILILIIIIHVIGIPGESTLSPVLAIFLAGGGTLIFAEPFETFFERNVLGIPIPPEALTRQYSSRITTSLEMADLQHLLLDEVMPSLMVRQFIQLRLQNGELIPLSILGVTPEMIAGLGSPAVLGQAAEKNIAAGANPTLPAWVRLVIPLRVSNKVQGYWLFGQRDPDDRYNSDEISTIRTLADQTALALANIDQAENLRALYFADIDRREVERTHLATELHDDVLNQMAMLCLSLQDTTPAALEAYQKATSQIREIINGLRPAMLNYGLFPALESLVDELNDRQHNGPKITLDVPSEFVRYDPRVELYLFRITQQACNNAIQHAQCNTIRISGGLTDSGAELQVSDDGQGFPAGSMINLPALLARKHFGLAAMFERAALIGAELHIDSQPGRGSIVRLSWKKNRRVPALLHSPQDFVVRC